MDSWQEELMQHLLTARSETELLNLLQRAAAELGFENCAYGMRVPTSILNPKIILLNTYPTKWQECYARNNFLEVDPTVAHGMKSLMPVIWSDKIFSSSRALWEEARAHNLRTGWAQSCFNAKGVGGLLTLVRSHDELSPLELKSNSFKMSWLVQVAHEGLSKTLTKEHFPEASITLTDREIEVLQWSADGKTTAEIGDILNIAIGTVNFHVNNSVKKLEVTNKMAASVKAAMLHLI